ncbi:MAG: ATP-binding protein [Candidatus Cybelea sp.]
MSQLVYERMRDALEQLNMPRALEQVDALLDRAGSSELTTVELLDQLLGAELSARRERSITMRLKLAGLPGIKTIEQSPAGRLPIRYNPKLYQEGTDQWPGLKRLYFSGWCCYGRRCA